MSEQFSPRTVAVVALASLVGGFVVVFGAGMLALRPRAPDPGAADEAGREGPSPTARALPPGDAARPGEDAPSLEAGAAGSGDGGEGTPTSAAGVTIAPSVTARCFDQASPAVIPGARCDRLAALDAHFLARAPAIAGCARGRGHLTFIMDFRFSTSFVRAWGAPTSTIASAGLVASCVRRVTAPLPLAAVPHAHDRYLLVYAIDW